MVYLKQLRWLLLVEWEWFLLWRLSTKVWHGRFYPVLKGRRYIFRTFCTKLIKKSQIFEMELNCPVLNLTPRVSEFFLETTLLNLVIIPETLISFPEFNCICLSISKIMSTNPSGKILDSISCPLFVAIQMVLTIEFKFSDGMYSL